MIQIVDGKIGGGKTYFAVMDTLAFLASGGTVYSNIDFCVDGVRRYLKGRYGVGLEDGQLVRLPEEGELRSWWDVIRWGSLDCPVRVIIDEGQLWYNAHDWKKTQTEDRSMLSFLTQSRKAGVDVMFITQVQGTLNKQFRDQAEIYWTAVNLSKVKLPIFGAVFKNLFYWCCRDARTKLILERRFRRFSRAVGSCYKTEAMLDTQMREMAKRQGKRIARRRLAKVGLFSRVVALLELEYPIIIKVKSWLKKKRSLKYEVVSNTVSSWRCGLGH